MTWEEQELREVRASEKLEERIERKRLKKENFFNLYECSSCGYIGNGWGVLFSGAELISVNPEERDILPCPKCGQDVSFSREEWAEE